MTTQKIEVSIQATAEALRADLREPVSKSFKASPRGLIAALKFASGWRSTMNSTLGNLSRPVVALRVEGKSVPFDSAVMNCQDERGAFTVARATRVLAGIGC